MTEFKNGEAVILETGARAIYVKADGPGRCIVRLGYDTRIVNPVTLRKAD